MSEGVVISFYRQSRTGLASNPNGGKHVSFELSGRRKKCGRSLEPVTNHGTSLPGKGDKIDLVTVIDTPDGPHAIEWRLLQQA